ncbi:MAG: phage tail protein [Candidatus Solibacter sp.]
MQTIFELKEQAVTDTPLLLFDCLFPDGMTERWSTHRVSVSDAEYSARVLRHNAFEMQATSDQGIDSVPRISLILANADSHCSQIERATGWKGAKLTVSLVFYDLRNREALTDRQVVFQGICNPPDEILEATFRITATNRMNLQRLLLPQVRIQRRCPWEFPNGEPERLEAIDGGENGKYSRYFRCGYSAGLSGGDGALDGATAFLGCDYTRSDCEMRGMFHNFGGIEFVPPVISVRTAGDKSYHSSAVALNEARYNDFVPMVYGTAWYQPPIVFARNDGNLTRMEVLLGMGEIQGVLKVLVNDIEIPAGVSGTNMTGTGWYNIPTCGTRRGTFNADFQDGGGQPAGDAYGSMAYLSLVVPNRISNGQSLPKIAVLLNGLKLPVYGSDGQLAGEQFSANPAWVILDLLRRSGWKLTELDIASFASVAAYCGEGIQALDLYGNDIQLARFECNLVLQKRRSTGDVIRGVRNASRLLLSYGANGRLQLRVENSIALEMPEKAAWSNSQEELNGGWPSYEFGDGSNGISGILRKSSGEPSFRLFSRSMADTPNRFSVEFQDALNEYQQDSFSVVDADDVGCSGQEVSQALAAIGLPNFDQAARILKLNLDRSVRGNLYVEFETSVKAFGIRPGDLITVTYLKEGLSRQPFRVLKIAPGANHRITGITAQVHDDSWYTDSNGQMTSGSGGRRQANSSVGLPRPLCGDVLDEHGNVQFSVAEVVTTTSDGSLRTDLTVGFVPPASTAGSGPGIPLLNLAPTIAGGGTLNGGQILYYAVAAVNASGSESPLSFIVRASILSGQSSVRLDGLSFSKETSSFNVYRGATPAQLWRIASDQPVATEFIDDGRDKELAVPPDMNFDHANFYWRMELQGEMQATTHGASSIGSDGLHMTDNRYRGMIARITRGKGAGQERHVSANSEAELTVSPAWTVVPDSSSHFVVCEGGWQFGGLAKGSPIQFEVSGRGGETMHICGRSANVNDLECAQELSTVTRWQMDGSSTGDVDVPPLPSFGLTAGQRGGSVELSGVSFADLTNTSTVSSATLTLHYWNELNGTPDLRLSGAVDEAGTSLELNHTGGAAPGDLLQVDAEVMRVDGVENGGPRYTVTRGLHSSTPALHEAGVAIYPLRSKTVISAFPPNFFGSPYSGSWSQAITLPDVRAGSAELFVTNRIGDSPIRSACFTSALDRGIRTLSGGQYSIQADGYLAVDERVAPALIVEASHSVRDIFAVLGSAADAEVRIRVDVDGAQYCVLSIPAGMTVSAAADGAEAGPLAAGAKLTVAVLSVGRVFPGTNLTVLVRL